MRGARALGSLLCITGCERELSIGELLDASLVTADSAAPDDTAFCARRGPLYTLRDGAGACGNDSNGMHYALCSCGDVVTNMLVQTDGFDSQGAPYTPGAGSGALATGGAFDPHPATIGGSLIVAGDNGIPLTADLRVGGNLFDQGQLQGEFAVTVGGRARVGGDVRVSSFIAGGDISVARGAAYELAGTPATVARGDVSVPAPCSCAGGLDIAALVAAARSANDDAALGVDAETWLKVLDAPVERTVPCGRYFVEAINAQQPITLHVQGRVALYVGDGIVVENSGALRIDLAPDAELDLFIANNISAAGVVQVGDVDAPTRARLHMGGDSAFFSGPTTLASTFYAPAANVVTQGPFELYGAALVANVFASDSFTLHYDRALAEDSCSAARCQSDADCSASLRCDLGSCLP